MHTKKIPLVFFLALWMAGAWACPAQATDLAILSDLGVDNRDGAVSLGFTIVITNPAELLDILQTGGEFEISCEAQLYRRRPFLWDDFMGQTAYVCRLSSNPMARECMVQDERGRHTYGFDTLPEDLAALWATLSLPLVAWDEIERNNLYLVRTTFKILRTSVSPWVNKPLFFMNFDPLPATIYDLNFEY